ncbi:HAAS signaling domain-containing protein [Streptomyces sp. URMC 127]|uniref:HAAS signaling domain-containing protein n=1 Tax=Streptomyces sp. URMC 127 TaxID=3423402 RepID=UPI003F1D0FCF
MTVDLPPNPIAEKYLAELEHAAADLPAGRRGELLADVRSHIAVARAEARTGNAPEDGDDPAVRAILRQLGDPQEIAAAARADLPAADSRAAGGSAKRDTVALTLLIAGGVLFWLIPVLSWVAWLIGLVLLLRSRRWTASDKLAGVAGTALAPVVLSGTALFVSMPGPFLVLAVVALLAVVIFTTVHLVRRTRHS